MQTCFRLHHNAHKTNSPKTLYTMNSYQSGASRRLNSSRQTAEDVLMYDDPYSFSPFSNAHNPHAGFSPLNQKDSGSHSGGEATEDPETISPGHIVLIWAAIGTICLGWCGYALYCAYFYKPNERSQSGSTHSPTSTHSEKTFYNDDDITTKLHSYFEKQHCQLVSVFELA